MPGLNLWILPVALSWQITLRQFSTLGEPPGLFQHLLGSAYARVGISETRLRPSIMLMTGPVRFHGAAELDASWGSVRFPFLLFARPAPLRWRPLSFQDSTGSVRLLGEVDRLEIRTGFGPLSLTLGRQPVSLGSSHLLGILDVLAPFPPFALDADIKPGVDLLRVNMGIGDAVGARVLFHNRDNMVAQFSQYLAAGTLEGTVGRIRSFPWVAMDWEGTREETAGWVEGMLLKGYGSLAVGVERHFPHTRITLEWIGQSPEPENRSTEVWAWIQQGLRKLACHRCLLGAVERRWHPLIRSSLAGIYSQDDGSLALMAQVMLDLSDAQDMVIWGYEGFPDRATHPGTVGGTGRWIGLYVRWSW